MDSGQNLQAFVMLTDLCVISPPQPQHVQQLHSIRVWQVPTQWKGQWHWVIQDLWRCNDRLDLASVIRKLDPSNAKAPLLSPLPGSPHSCDLPLNRHYLYVYPWLWRFDIIKSALSGKVWRQKRKTARLSKPNHAKPVVKLVYRSFVIQMKE